MDLFKFFQIASDSNISKGEVEALAGLLSGSNITKSEGEAVESFLDKQRVVLREFHMSELFQRGRERFGEPASDVSEAIEAIPDPERLEELLKRVRNFESWEELLASPPALGDRADR
jgi:hypothetical protein